MPLYPTVLVGIAFLLPAYLIRFSVWGIPTTLLEVAIWAAAILGLLQPHVRRSWAQTWKNFSLPRVALAKWGIFLFLFSAVVSTVFSPDLETSLGILKGWIITPMLYGFMVYAATQTSSPAKLGGGEVRARILKALILSGLIVALLGLSQLGQLDRIRGPYDVPNSLALYLAPLITLAAFLPLTKGKSRAQRGEGVFSRLAAVVMFTALLFTQSLAGALAVVIALAVGLFLSRRNPLIPLDKGRSGGILLVAGIVILSVATLAPKVNYLLQPHSSVAVRLQLWSISWDLIQEHPLAGIGLGTFEPAYQNALHKRFEKLENGKQKIDAKLPLREFVFRDPHNWVLSFWLNTGLLGLVSFIGLHIYVVRYAWRANHSQFLVSIFQFLPLATLLLVGLVDTIYWKNDLAVLHWLLLGLLMASAETSALPPHRQTAY